MCVVGELLHGLPERASGGGLHAGSFGQAGQGAKGAEQAQEARRCECWPPSINRGRMICDTLIMCDSTSYQYVILYDMHYYYMIFI